MQIIKRIHPQGPISGLVNNTAGTLRTQATDTYGNPISNAPLLFEVVKTESTMTATNPLPPVYRTLTFYDHWSCGNPYPLYGDCPVRSAMTVTSAYDGSQVATMIGNTLSTHYEIQVSAPGSSVTPEKFDVYSDGSRRAKNEYVPSVLLAMGLDIVNDQGEAVTASKAGTPLGAPLSARLLFFQDEYDVVPETCQRQDSSGNPETYTGYGLVSRGTVSVRPVSDGIVTFTTTTGAGTAGNTQNAGGGHYLATYATGSAPAVNTVEVGGKATLTVPLITAAEALNGYFPDTHCLESQILPTTTVMLEHGQHPLFSRSTHALLPEKTVLSKQIYTVYGVGTSLTIEPPVVLVDEDGYAAHDTTLAYTILPPAYNAVSMTLDSFTKDQNDNETWAGMVFGDKTEGTGQIIYVRGAKFDPRVRYLEQVVLNRGMAAEIRGDRKSFTVVQIETKTDESASIAPVDELKFGDGSKPNKRYKIELMSADLAQNCNNGTIGVIRTVMSSGQTATTPGTTYAPAELPLTSQNSNGSCVVKVGGKGRFILSNRSTADLQQQNTLPDDTAVLYGGIGNRVQVIVNNTIVKVYPTEPVGVIVLAIDGLRQDVLYTKDEQDVNVDQNGVKLASPYYVQPKELKGLCDVFGGKIKFDEVIDPVNPDLTIVLPTGDCQENYWTDRHVKLPKVTAIFPSITYASWASIFTGKQAGETGIMGNEYFARDLYEAGTTFPGLSLSGSPLGMITYSDGSFSVGCGWTGLRSHLNKACFYSKYVLPADWHDGDGQKEKAIPRLTLQAPTVYEELAPVLKGFHTPPAGSTISCDASEYECRSAVVFNHYAKGADRWRTMSGVLKPIWEYLTGGESNVMDSTPAAEAKSFINNYFSQDNPLGKRKRFPALFTVYFAGLDHEAHAEGMGAYRNFFTKTTDAKIGVVIKALKDHDEFENKIFIAVADHGMTAMPEDLTFVPSDLDSLSRPAEMSCKLIVDGYNVSDVREAEQANNNLHIWELGEVMLQLNKLYAEIYPGTDSPQKLGYKILAPSQIADLYKNSVYGAKVTLSEASVIAALNGPMAHIYIKDRTSSDWNTHGRTVEDIGYLSEVLRLLLSTDKTPSNLPDMFPEGLIEYVLFDTVGLNQNMTYSVDAILVRKSVSSGERYCVYKGIKPDKSDIECVSLQSIFTNSNYVKAVERINGMESQYRSGDIVLVMRDATSGNAIDRYTTGVACKSWHGSSNASDSYVPFTVSYPGGNRFELEPIIKKTEVCGSQMTCEGNWKVTDMIKEFIKIQY